MYVSCCRKRKKEEARFSLGNINLGEDNLYLKYITVNSSCLSALFRLMNARNDSGEFKIFLNVDEKKNLFHASSATLWLRWLLLLSSVCAHWIQKKKCGAINYCSIQLTPSLSSLLFFVVDVSLLLTSSASWWYSLICTSTSCENPALTRC